MATTANHVWRPSASRVLVLDGFIPGPRGLPMRPAGPLRWPPKDPADVLDYQFDIAPALAGNDGDTISTLDILIDPSDDGDLSVASAAADGARAVLWLQGGQDGTTYTVTLTLGTQAGRSLTRSVLLPVIAMSAQATTVLTTETGSPLTDDSGNALDLS